MAPTLRNQEYLFWVSSYMDFNLKPYAVNSPGYLWDAIETTIHWCLPKNIILAALDDEVLDTNISHKQEK